MHVIGEETAERLDVIPAQYRVLVTRRPKYACRACSNGIVQAPAPERLIKGGLPTEATVAHVLVSKYAWHLPLYRQAQMLRSQGIVIERMTLASWVGYAAAELAPVVARLREILLGSVKLAVDETPVPVLDPGRGRTKIGYFWSMARDDRPWGSEDPPAVDLQLCARPRRGARDQAARRLLRHRAVRRLCGLQAIGSTAGATAAPQHSPSAGRTGEDDSMRSQSGASPDRAGSARAHCCALCRSRSGSAGAAPRNARAVRQAESKPLVDALKIWLESELSARLRQIGYCWRNPLWPQALGGPGALSRRRSHRDGHQCRSSARSVRSRLLARTHCSPAATKVRANWAAVASLIETCKLNGVDPQAYLDDVLTKLVNLWPASRIDELMPWAWLRAQNSTERIAA